jgi:TetR/AcrR family transcriptional regulator, transcriptional repressor for nem operon
VITSPTTARGRATVNQILDAACVLFARKGVRATTLDGIGAAAGVGRGQLYHFFQGKADLVVDVIVLQIERVIDAIRPSFDAMSTGADLRAWCEQAVAFHASSSDPLRCPIGSLIYELDGDETARETLQAGFARWEALFAKGLRRIADNNGLVAGLDPSVLAGGLLAAYQGGLLLADLTGDVEPLRRALHSVVGAALAPMSIA